MNRNCDYCKKQYLADLRNIKRGWGLCCSKSCAANKREKNKPNYNPLIVALNNERRDNWNNRQNDFDIFADDDQSWDAHKDSC